MADGTKIEWTDATWNPITGCEIVSPGCTNCYAMKLAGTRLMNIPSRKGLTRPAKAGPVWTGEMRLNEEWLCQPIAWRKPRMIFVCAHSDLFQAPFDWIDIVFAVMATTPRHTYQVLTKRSARMREYFSADAEALHTRWLFAARALLGTGGEGEISGEWPLPNVWLGVSTERQKEADERIPHLLATPAAVRFISAEPLLGPIDLDRIHESYDTPGGGRVDSWESALNGKRFDMWAGDDEDPMQPGHPRLDWVIVGGESGLGYRPMEPAWAASIGEQCKGAGVAFFLKQMAGKKPIPADMLIRQFPEVRP